MNQDKTSQQLAMLRSKIQQLELELQEFKSGRMVVSEDGSVVVNDMASEITMLRTENDKCVVECRLVISAVYYYDVPEYTVVSYTCICVCKYMYMYVLDNGTPKRYIA